MFIRKSCGEASQGSPFVGCLKLGARDGSPDVCEVANRNHREIRHFPGFSKCQRFLSPVEPGCCIPASRCVVEEDDLHQPGDENYLFVLIKGDLLITEHRLEDWLRIVLQVAHPAVVAGLAYGLYGQIDVRNPFRPVSEMKTGWPWFLPVKDPLRKDMLDAIGRIWAENAVGHAEEV